MNKRIQKLANQAEDYADSIVDQGGEFHPAYTEKFAELIVRECANRCEDIAFKHQVNETTYSQGKKAGAFECAAGLRKHFGVKE